MKFRVWLAATVFLAMVGAACQTSVAKLTEQDKAAIRKLDEAAAGQPAASVKRTEISLDGAGDFAYRHYAYERTAVPGGTSAAKGKGIQVFQRQSDGSWRVVSEVSNVEEASAGLIIPTTEMAADASPEVQKLAGIVGRWTVKAAESNRKDVSDEGTRTEVMTCSWFPGGRDVICRSIGLVDGKEEIQLDHYGYDPSRKIYAVTSNNNASVTATGTVSVQPSAWIRTLDWEDDNGVKFKSRVTFHNLAMGGGEWRAEYAVADSPWATVWAGTYAKQQ